MGGLANMPPHPDRVRSNYPACFNEGHDYCALNGTNIAPIINEDKTRTTIWQCIKCGDKLYYTRTQEQFGLELETSFTPEPGYNNKSLK